MSSQLCSLFDLKYVWDSLQNNENKDQKNHNNLRLKKQSQWTQYIAVVTTATAVAVVVFVEDVTVVCPFKNNHNNMFCRFGCATPLLVVFRPMIKKYAWETYHVRGFLKDAVPIKT